MHAHTHTHTFSCHIRVREDFSATEVDGGLDEVTNPSSLNEATTRLTGIAINVDPVFWQNTTNRIRLGESMSQNICAFKAHFITECIAV